jgi:hypothetical protein
MVNSNKNYDSFKVGSNFYIRLRKEDIDLNNSKGAFPAKVMGMGNPDDVGSVR